MFHRFLLQEDVLKIFSNLSQVKKIETFKFKIDKGTLPVKYLELKIHFETKVFNDSEHLDRAR